jgi:Tfp pilus assembly protein PilV
MRSERGFGLLELVVAVVILNVGLLALVAALQSGVASGRRASRTSTAASLADAQLERYRALAFDSVELDAARTGTVDAAYQADLAPGATLVTRADCGAAPPPECLPTQPLTGADGASYRVDSYVVARSSRLREVTVVVRDGLRSSVTLARAGSTFDRSG